MAGPPRAAWVDSITMGCSIWSWFDMCQWDWNDVWCGSTQGYRGYCHPDVFQPISMLVYHNDGNGHFTEVRTNWARQARPRRWGRHWLTTTGMGEWIICGRQRFDA